MDIYTASRILITTYPNILLAITIVLNNDTEIKFLVGDHKSPLLVGYLQCLWNYLMRCVDLQIPITLYSSGVRSYILNVLLTYEKTSKYDEHCHIKSFLRQIYGLIAPGPSALQALCRLRVVDWNQVCMAQKCLPKLVFENLFTIQGDLFLPALPERRMKRVIDFELFCDEYSSRNMLLSCNYRSFTLFIRCHFERPLEMNTILRLSEEKARHMASTLQWDVYQIKIITLLLLQSLCTNSLGSNSQGYEKKFG